MDNKIISQLGTELRGLNIKLLGDSITQGVGGSGFCQNGEHIVDRFSRNPDGFCWAKMLKERLESDYNCRVTNNGCSGTDIQFIIQHFDTLVSEDDDLIICTIGTNNRHQYKNTGERCNKEEFAEEFYRNILKLNEMLASKGKKVIFMANIPASAANERDGRDYWRILHMDDINELYKRAGREAGFTFISLYDRFSAYLEENSLKLDGLLADGLHPNDEGYKLMYKLITEALGVA